MVVGEPADDFKKAMLEVNLAAKQAELDAVHQALLDESLSPLAPSPARPSGPPGGHAPSHEP